MGSSTVVSGIVKSYPKSVGKGGTWHVEGWGIRKGWGVHTEYCTTAYAICCK